MHCTGCFVHANGTSGTRHSIHRGFGTLAPHPTPPRLPHPPPPLDPSPPRPRHRRPARLASSRPRPSLPPSASACPGAAHPSPGRPRSARPCAGSFCGSLLPGSWDARYTLCLHLRQPASQPASSNQSSARLWLWPFRAPCHLGTQTRVHLVDILPPPSISSPLTTTTTPTPTDYIPFSLPFPSPPFPLPLPPSPRNRLTPALLFAPLTRRPSPQQWPTNRARRTGLSRASP